MASGISLPFGPYQLMIDGVASGNLVVQTQTVVATTPTGNVLAIGGTALGGHFGGTFTEATEAFAARAPVVGIWQWRFQGKLNFQPYSQWCAQDENFYVLTGNYTLYSVARAARAHYGTRPGEASSSPGEPSIQVLQGSWSAYICYPAISL